MRMFKVVLLTAVGFLAACGDKGDDTGSDTAEAADSGDSGEEPGDSGEEPGDTGAAE